MFTDMQKEIAPHSSRMQILLIYVYIYISPLDLLWKSKTFQVLMLSDQNSFQQRLKVQEKSKAKMYNI